MNIFLVEVCFIIWLVCMIRMLLVICWIIVRLWLMNKYVKFRLVCRLVSRFRICVCINMLSVDIVLLYINIFGCSVSVCVIVICCC